MMCIFLRLFLLGLMIAFYSTNVLTHFETQRALVTKLIPYLESNFSSVRQLDPVTSEMRSLQGEIKGFLRIASKWFHKIKIKSKFYF